jgi:hypothetical protein
MPDVGEVADGTDVGLLEEESVGVTDGETVGFELGALVGFMLFDGLSLGALLGK